MVLRILPPVTVPLAVMFPAVVKLPTVAVPITPRLGKLGNAPAVITRPPIVAVVPVATRFPFVTLRPPAEK